MAIVINPLLGEIRGKFGNGVFRNVRGKTTLSVMPWTDKKKRTPRQKEREKVFGDASRKARSLLTRKVREEYNEKAFNAGNTMSGWDLLLKEVLEGKR